MNRLSPRWQVVVTHVRSGRTVEPDSAFYTYRAAVRRTNQLNGWFYRRGYLTTTRAIVVDRFPHRNLPYM